MPEPSSSRLLELERAEWQAVLAALERTPRLANLLRFVGELYFQSKINEINEFYIATKVFGRSESVFDPSKDSIARVEAHRLRKKLKEFYQADGKNHSTVLSIPVGGYVPSFLHRSVPVPLPPVDAAPPDSPKAGAGSCVERDKPGTTESPEHSEVESKPLANGHKFRQLAKLAGFAVGVSLLIAAVLFTLKYRSLLNHPLGANESSLKSLPVAASRANSLQVPVRLLCGYDGTPRIDSAGNYWEADHYFRGGVARTFPDQHVFRTSDPMLFEHWRVDTSIYDIPLAPGVYELHLFFVAAQTENANQLFFDVNANGKPLLQGFNISSDALGTDIADERIFRDISLDSGGYLHLTFSSDQSTPSISAIEILPGLPHKQLPIRLVMQPSAVTDSHGDIWHPDNYFQGGTLSDVPQVVTGTSDPNLYSGERYGHFTYAIPVDPRDHYTLVLHFSELYWGPDQSVGRRVFNVFCNGSTLLDHFDIFKETGSLHAVTKTFHHLQPSPEGKLNLTFEPISNFATVSAIEVIDEGN